jgi:hypothetical protein
MRELVNRLNETAYQYYTLDNPTITDKEWDAMYDELVRLEAETGERLPDSPTRRVGGEVLAGFEPHTHLARLWSMGKAQSIDELRDWAKRAEKLRVEAGLPELRYVVEHKFDGLTVNLTYENGELTAVSYDSAGWEIGRKTLTTAGVQTQLRIEPESAPEQGKLCWVRLRYTDENGIGKPMERGHVKVTVTGGRLIGLGSACPFYPESYLDSTTDTYYGEALAVVLPEGDMTITADDGKHHTETSLPIA